MRKTDKKRDNQLRLALTAVCEAALKEIDGFQWLTHRVNYANFPSSLKVICVFDTSEKLAIFMATNGSHLLAALMQVKLAEVGVNIKDMSAQIAYDTEEDCASQRIL
jgi:hypothetical protein